MHTSAVRILCFSRSNERKNVEYSSRRYMSLPLTLTCLPYNTFGVFELQRKQVGPVPQGFTEILEMTPRSRKETSQERLMRRARVAPVPSLRLTFIHSKAIASHRRDFTDSNQATASTLGSQKDSRGFGMQPTCSIFL